MMSGCFVGFVLFSCDEWWCVLVEWVCSDGVIWIYVFKVFCVVFLIFWLVMCLELL